MLDWNEHSEPKGTGTDDSSLDTERRVTKVILVVPATEDRLRIAVLAEDFHELVPLQLFAIGGHRAACRRRAPL